MSKKPTDPEELPIVATCMDKTKAWNTCGICGADNMESTGVVRCDACGEEEFYSIEGKYGYHFYDKIDPPSCGCKNKPFSYKGNLVCSNCGATYGSKCPACGKKVWSKGYHMFCKNNCGYKI